MKPTSEKWTRPRTWVHNIAAALLVVLIGVAASEMRVREPVKDLNLRFPKAVETLNVEGHAVRRNYTGVEAIDGVFRFLVVAFLPGTAGFDKGFQVLCAHFLVAFFPVISLFCVEAGRKVNRGSLISFPAIWAIFYQTVGGALIIPLFYLAHLHTTGRSNYFSPTATRIPISYAKSLLPSLWLGYLLPTILLFLPYSDIDTTQIWTALWQPTPFFVSLISFVLSSVLSDSTQGDLKYLNALYLVLFLVSATAHIGTLFVCLTSSIPNVSLATVFDPRVGTTDPTLVLTRGLKYIFQIDFWVIFSATFVWAFLAVHDMRQLRKTNLGLLQSLFVLTLGTLCVGPAATLSAVWYWREQLLAKTKTA